MKKIFLNVFLVAGLSAATVGCKDENKEAATSEAREAAMANEEAVQFEIDTTSSVIEWQGAKPTGKHTGTIQIEDGALMANDSIIESGRIVIDMESINVTDLQGEEKQNLEAHLKGTVEGKEGDFFDVTKYPEASFEITGVTQKEGKTFLQGNLTMKEETKNVEIPVNINRNGETLQLTSEPFTIDRTKWGVNYGSKSVFDSLGDNFIDDEIQLTINVTARRAS